jgi:predicted nucleotidyltransferase
MPDATLRAVAVAHAAELRELFGDALRSVVLHGSVARGEAVAGVSDVNLLVLLERASPDDLAAASPLARRWAEAGESPPLLMTWDEWQRAADAFAIELADMKDAHEVLHGANPLDALVVEPAALRLQAERELRGKLVQLRQGLLLYAAAPESIGRLLLLALPAFAAYFRAALRLAGRPSTGTTGDVVRAVAELVDADPAPFLEAWAARESGGLVSREIGDPQVTGYYDFAKRTARWVDALDDGEER